jgi:hypothetical protein
VIVQHLSPEIEVFELGARRLYAKTTGGTFAIFEDELTPEELIAIARDIKARKAEQGEPGTVGGTHTQDA